MSWKTKTRVLFEFIFVFSVSFVGFCLWQTRPVYEPHLHCIIFISMTTTFICNKFSVTLILFRLRFSSQVKTKKISWLYLDLHQRLFWTFLDLLGVSNDDFAAVCLDTPQTGRVRAGPPVVLSWGRRRGWGRRLRRCRHELPGERRHDGVERAIYWDNL